MQTSLSHLPPKKQEELAIIKEIILANAPVEMIILFGSHSTGKWVEDLYVEDETIYEYASDFDILVVTKKERSAEKEWRWSSIENKIRERKMLTDTHIIAHGIGFLNEKIRDNYYFFVDLLKEGTLLYDKGNYQLATPQPLSPQKRKKKAQDYFEDWFEAAKSSLKGFNFYLKEQEYKEAAFELHQATEDYYTTFLLVFTDYKPKLHDIEKLGNLASKIKAEMATAFPRSTEEEKRLFKLLQKAYIDARYRKKSYVITKEELDYLAERVKVLETLTKELCEAEIKKYDRDK
ncbi:MAG: HEPN domain-containing protein [Cytophagales bacterium]|nr:HEPN domain-containing protein [Cytophagales bacterium]